MNQMCVCMWRKESSRLPVVNVPFRVQFPSNYSGRHVLQHLRAARRHNGPRGRAVRHKVGEHAAGVVAHFNAVTRRFKQITEWKSYDFEQLMYRTRSGGKDGDKGTIWWSGDKMMIEGEYDDLGRRGWLGDKRMIRGPTPPPHFPRILYLIKKYIPVYLSVFLTNEWSPHPSNLCM